MFGAPAFFNPAQDDYHLGAGSAEVNAGKNDGVNTDFDGDGQSGSGSSVSHMYAAPGSYHVTVKAPNGAGFLTDAMTVEVIAPRRSLFLPLVR